MYKHWSYNPTRETFTGTHEIAEHLPPGLYHIGLNHWGDPQASKEKLKDDVLCPFQEGPMKPIVDEVGQFWESGDHYKSLGVTHKRGVLLHGPAGCGKTGIVSVLIQDIIRRKGLAVMMHNVEQFQKAIPLLRQIEEERKILAIIEDIDDVCEYDEEELLEVMDGSSSLGHGLMFLATTNHLDRIPVRVRCRPSRIDTLIEVPLPDVKQRHEYLKFLCSNGFNKSDEELADWAERTNKFSLASLKELVISVIIYKRTIDESIDRLKGLSSQKDKQEDE